MNPWDQLLAEHRRIIHRQLIIHAVILAIATAATAALWYWGS